ncbi:MAG TPA: M48 family metalloprotease [Acidimicrobiales bacterium]|nr:M48 family metalloprotease [Acidimicrobiales bacterium]
MASTTTDRFQPRVDANRRRARVLLGGVGAATFVVVWLVFAVIGVPLVGVVVAVGSAVGAVLALDRSADDYALTRVGATPADPLVHARFHNVVEGLCVAAGLPKPLLNVLEDEALNALALGRDPRTAALVVTSGLLEKLTRIELEGVLAHELCHIKALDTLVSTIAIGTVGRVAPRLVPKVVGGPREALADVTGVALTRYPPGLISALEKVRDDPCELGSPNPAIAHLWIDAPATDPLCPPLEERIQALREL